MSHAYINNVIHFVLCVLYACMSEMWHVVKITVNHLDLKMDTWHWLF